MVELKDVSVTYSSGVDALHNVNQIGRAHV